MAAGKLHVVATPIGNLEDITLRAVRILREVDLIAAEDTRHSRRLLRHLGISKPLTSYHDHNEENKADVLLRAMEQGQNVALISDAGTPCISDPGYHIVRAARLHGFEVVCVPGPCSIPAALSVSGLPSDQFTYHGFLPRKGSAASSKLEELAKQPGTHVFLEAANRLVSALQRMDARFPDAQVLVARELTKIHEEVVSGTPRSLADHYAGSPPKGECVLLLRILDTMCDLVHDPDHIRALVEEAMRQEGLSRRDAIREVSETHRIPRNHVYAVAMEKK